MIWVNNLQYVDAGCQEKGFRDARPPQTPDVCNNFPMEIRYLVLTNREVHQQHENRGHAIIKGTMVSQIRPQMVTPVIIFQWTLQIRPLERQTPNLSPPPPYKQNENEQI